MTHLMRDQNHAKESRVHNKWLDLPHADQWGFHKIENRSTSLVIPKCEIKKRTEEAS